MKEKEKEVTAIAFITTRSTCQEYIYAYSVCSTAAFIYGCVSKWEKTFGFTWLTCRYRGGRVGLVMQQTRDMPLGSQKIPEKEKNPI